MSKQGLWSKKRCVLAWLLSLAIAVSLVSVPKKVEAESTEVSLDVTNLASTTTSDTTVEVRFSVPDAYDTLAELSAAGLTSLEVTVKVTSYTASGSDTPGAQAFIGYGEEWASCSSWVDLQTAEITTTADFSSLLSGSGTVYAYGVQFANVSAVTYEIVSAKLVGTSTASSVDTTVYNTTRDYSTNVSVAVNAQGTPSADWSGYNLEMTNSTGQTITDWIIVLTVSETVAAAFSKVWSSTYVMDGTTIYIYPQTDGSNATLASGTMSSYVPGIGFAGTLVNASDITVSAVYYNYGESSQYDYSSGETNDDTSGSTSGGTVSDSTTDLNLDIEYNYAKLLQESLYFYDANMCGPNVGETSAFSWRNDCHTEDQTATYNGQTVDVSGGFHDAGDHVKFGLPQGYAASVLALSYYEFGDAFDELGQTAHLKTIMDYFCDYFVNCAIYSDNDNKTGTLQAFCYNVGDGTDGSSNSDHGYWGAPENQSGYNRSSMTLFTDSSMTATDIVSLSACALALHAYNFPNAENASTYLQVAKDLFAYAKSNTKACYVVTQYGSDSWEDDYCSAAAALYLATKDESYLTELNTYYGSVNTGWVLCWNKTWGIAAALKEDWSSVYSIASYGSTTTAQGFKFIDGWGSARYNTSEQFLGLVYDQENNSSSFGDWATGQMKYLLGNNTSKRCFIVGYNENSSKYPHHRAASNSTDAGTVSENHYTLLGALVGGPTDTSDSYTDSQSDYQSNEVAIDYNATLVGAAAGLYLLHKDDEDAVNDLADEDELSALAVTTYYTGEDSDDTDNTSGTPALTSSVSSLALEAAYGETTAAQKTVTITNSGDGAAKEVTVALTAGTAFSASLSSTTIKAGKTATLTITPKSGLTVGSYEDTVTITCGNQQVTISLTLSVSKQTVNEITFPAASSIQYGQSLSASELTGGSTAYGIFAWQEETETINEVGTISRNVVFTPADTDNYDYSEVSGYVNQTVIQAVSVEVTKADQTKVPDQAVVTARTSDSITVEDVSGVEYSIDDGTTWQASNVFTGLSAFCAYDITVRYAATDIYNAGQAQEAVTVYTLVADPYTIDVSMLENEEYVAALCSVADGSETPTVSYTDGVLTLTQTEGAYTLTGTNEDLKVEAHLGVDITLSDVNINSLQLGMEDDEKKETTLTLDGTNTVTGGIQSTGTLTITGDGSLTIENTADGGTGISADVLIIESGTLNVTAASQALTAVTSITISGGTVTAVTTGDGSAMSAGSQIALLGGSISTTLPADSSAYDFSVDSTSGSIVIDGAVITGTPTYSVELTDTDGNTVTLAVITILNENGGTLSAMQVNAGSKITLSELNITTSDGTSYAASKSGYTLSWSVNGTVYALNTTLTITSDTTLQAVWTKNVIDISGAQISVADTNIYTGEALTPAVTVTLDGVLLVSGTDYTVSYSNNINPGTATVVVTGIGNYTGSRTLSFTIDKRVISVESLTVEEIEPQYYTGDEITPDITIMDGDDILTEDDDYVIVYQNNVNIGTATVIITGQGDYTGTKTVTFSITVEKGEVYQAGNYQYEITKAAVDGTGTVSLVKVVKKATVANIASTVSIGGVSFKITEIGASAFKGNQKLTRVKIGKNVTSIGAKAFYGCTKLKTISVGAAVRTIGKKAFYNCKAVTTFTISSKKLTKKGIGTAAFKNMGAKNYKKLKVKVPKAKLAAYKKILTSKGLSKKAVIKK